MRRQAMRGCSASCNTADTASTITHRTAMLMSCRNASREGQCALLRRDWLRGQMSKGQEVTC